MINANEEINNPPINSIAASSPVFTALEVLTGATSELDLVSVFCKPFASTTAGLVVLSFSVTVGSVTFSPSTTVDSVALSFSVTAGSVTLSFSITVVSVALSSSVTAGSVTLSFSITVDSVALSSSVTAGSVTLSFSTTVVPVALSSSVTVQLPYHFQQLLFQLLYHLL